MENGFVSTTRYFNAVGRLVAVHGWNDYIDAKCRGVRDYGWRMACSHVVLDDFSAN
jgi:hypothetical protein